MPNAPATRTVVPTRPQLNRSRTKPLPPVHSNHSTAKSTQSATVKPSALPPIEDHKKNSSHLPIIFILSKSLLSGKSKRRSALRLGATGSTKLCSRLLERYEQIVYVSINDAANIDDDVQIGESDDHRRHYRSHSPFQIGNRWNIVTSAFNASSSNVEPTLVVFSSRVIWANGLSRKNGKRRYVEAID